jgi:hypothetical protein
LKVPLEIPSAVELHDDDAHFPVLPYIDWASEVIPARAWSQELDLTVFDISAIWISSPRHRVGIRARVDRLELGGEG